MRPIVWIVSYPRSGNTFVRALLANYLHATTGPVSINDLPRYAVGEHEEDLWAQITGRPAGGRTLELEWAARPQYFEAVRRRPSPSLLLVKSHTLNGEVFGRPAFAFAPGDRVIHLLRHPGDVAVSCADFYGISLETSVDRLLRSGALIDGRPRHGFEVLGSWAEHARSWLGPTGVPTLRLRYLDLLEEPVGALRAMVKFLDLPDDPVRARIAAAFSRFETLKRQEAAQGFVEAPDSALSGGFFRVGARDQWRDALPEAQARRLLEPHRDLLNLWDLAPSQDLAPARGIER